MPPRGADHPTAPRPRRPPFGNDAPPRHARPELAARGPRRVLLHPAARRPPPRPGRRRGVRRRPAPGPTLREWDVDPEDVRARLRPGMSTGEAIARGLRDVRRRPGKARWGDKTPMYMQYLACSSGSSPTALYLHLIRDGRDAAPSFCQMPAGIVTRVLGASDVGCRPSPASGDGGPGAARALGQARRARRYLELRYEELVDSPGGRAATRSASLPASPGSRRCSATRARWTSARSRTSRT